MCRCQCGSLSARRCCRWTGEPQFMMTDVISLSLLTSLLLLTSGSSCRSSCSISSPHTTQRFFQQLRSSLMRFSRSQVPLIRSVISVIIMLRVCLSICQSDEILKKSSAWSVCPSVIPTLCNWKKLYSWLSMPLHCNTIQVNQSPGLYKVQFLASCTDMVQVWPYHSRWEARLTKKVTILVTIYLSRLSLILLIFQIAGAPDPTAGQDAEEENTWHLDEAQVEIMTVMMTLIMIIMMPRSRTRLRHTSSRAATTQPPSTSRRCLPRYQLYQHWPIILIASQECRKSKEHAIMSI